MLTPTPLYHEVVEEVWTTAEYDALNGTTSFSVKGNLHVVNSDVINACFKLPENNYDSMPNNSEIVVMLNSMNYSLSTDNLGKIVRKGMVKEWSYLCDAFIKTCSGKITNFDVVTHSMLVMLNMLLSDKYFDFSTLVMYELVVKLGKKESRGKNIYFSRFLMILVDHVCNNSIVINNQDSKFSYFVQEKRVLSDLIRMNLNSEVQLVYLPIIQVTISNPSSSQPQTALTSIVAMEAVSAPQLPTQATKPKVHKSKSKKLTSGVSQKISVVKSTTHTEGSVQVDVRGEGRGESQRIPKNKVGEVSATQTSHHVSSQKDTLVQKEVSSFLVASYQKDVTIETSSQPGTHSKRVRDTPSQKKHFSNLSKEKEG
ncbi:hypothetical protein POM88_029192 [Heracleum sosnowskyi]|uniref:Uncharacterized protein n=1 Tax=Heracleum sosnowskyi TaxID=360622 RepID=A0AAD8HT68_9APIA|nr:hypothetical protein POM88_029192 [Heracleum sosnowskyi]